MRLIDDGYWLPIRDGEPAVWLLFQRHYSAKKHGGHRRTGNDRRFVGPGEKMVLTTLHYDALFAWRRARYRADNQVGVECAIFRNESTVLSSTLITEAMGLARMRWPHEQRMFTFVRPGAVKSSNPGYCFRCAGWRRCGVSKGGLVILEAICGD